MFKVGDKVRVITRDHGDDQFGDEGVLVGNIADPFDDFIYHVDILGKGPNVYREGDLELIEEPIEKPDPIAAPVAFMFIEEAFPGVGGKAAGMPFVVARMYKMEWLNSLEEAQEHCDRLKILEGGKNIHAYVRID